MAVNDYNLRLESDEEAEQSCEEKLFMFLYNAKAHHRAAELSQMFNVEFPFQKILDSCRDFLVDPEQVYADLVTDNAVIVDGERLVHISDFADGAVMRRKVLRCLEKMPSSMSKREDKCPVHSKKCRLIPFSYGFLCFLHLGIDDSQPETAQLISTAAPLEEEGVDEEITIDPTEERALVLSSVFPSEATTSSIAPIGDDQNKEQGDLPLPCFPSFPMVDKNDFVLLTDIMHLFNIREDYCLAAVASYSEADTNWVDADIDKHLLVDSAVKDSEYRSGKEILKEIFEEWSTHEAQMPSEEEHAAATNRLGLADMGKFQQPTIHEDSMSTVALWTGSLLEDDENQKVWVYDDDFLKRAGGSRASAPSSSTTRGIQKDAALAHYMEKFNHQKIIIYHKEYSEDNAKFPLFALKVLSRFCGGHEIANNAEKVILLEKQFALRIFGQGPGCLALRSPYYLAYAAGAIAAGIKDPATLTLYGKRDFLRSKKSRCIQEASGPRIELPTEEEEDEGEEGRPLKRIKPASSSDPSSSNLQF